MVGNYGRVWQLQLGHRGRPILLQPGPDRPVLVREPVGGDVRVLHRRLEEERERGEEDQKGKEGSSAGSRVSGT